ncbi:MAG: zinc-binding dehydrogenase, partial [Dehalococcoidia bacterium]|nr:zinc-binding dehydrogenase [Dehalococcoidia bacterium]
RPELMQQYRVNAIGQYTQVNNERLSNLAKLVEQKIIKVHVDKTFPLEKAGEALAYLQEGRVRGKIVIKIK